MLRSLHLIEVESIIAKKEKDLVPRELPSRISYGIRFPVVVRIFIFRFSLVIFVLACAIINEDGPPINISSMLTMTVTTGHGHTLLW